MVRRELRVRVAVCADSLHCSGAFSNCGSGAGQVDRRLCLGAFGCRAVGQLVSRLVSSDVGVAWDPLEGDGHALVHQCVHRRPDALGEAQLLRIRAALQELEAGEGVGAQHD